MADDDIGPPSYDAARIEARLAGYGWDEIDAHVDERSAEAIEAGYTLQEIDRHLGRGSPEDAQQRLNGDWSTRAFGDDALVSGLRTPHESIPLSPLEDPTARRIAGYAGREAPEPVMGDFDAPPPGSLDLLDDYAKGSYANALLRGEVRSPLDFAERYTAAAWNAAGAEADGAAMVRAAGGLASTLPSDEDFTDQAIAIAQSQAVALTPEGVQLVKDRLIGEWADTGMPLDAMYRRAYLDEEFGAKLTAPAEVQEDYGVLGRFIEGAGNVAEFWQGTSVGFRDMVGTAARMAELALPQPLVEAVSDANRYLVDLGVPLAPLPAGGIEQLEVERLKGLVDDDTWARMFGQIGAVLPVFSTLGFAGLWGTVAAGATGGAVFGAFKPTLAENFWTQKAEDVLVETGAGALGGAAVHGAFALVGKMISRMAPEAAETLGGIVGRMEEPRVKVLDPDALNGGETVPASKALEPVRPAEKLPPKPVAEGAAPEPASPLDFVPEATPAEKMGGLSRDWLMNKAAILEDLRLRNEGVIPDEFGPNFFRQLAAGQDPATIELAQGVDSARGIWDFMTEIGGRLMRDESGALTISRTAAQRDAEAARTGARDWIQDMLIRGMGRGARVMARGEHMLDPSTARLGALVPESMRSKALADNLDNSWARLNPHMAAHVEMLKRGPMADWSNDPIMQMMEFIQGRSAGVTIAPNHPLAPVADALRNLYQLKEKLMRDAEAEGLHTMTSYLDDYARQLWKDRNAYDRMTGVSKLGSSASFQKRKHLTYANGVRAGLEPAIPNPLELALYDLASATNYLHRLRVLKAGEGKDVIYWASKPRDDTDIALNGVPERQIASSATVGAQAAAAATRQERNLIRSQLSTARQAGDQAQVATLTAQLQTARATANAAVEAAAPTALVQRAYAHRGAATAWNDTIDIGFYKRPGAASTYDTILKIKNVSVGTLLLGPAFHMFTMVSETLTSGFLPAFRRIASGQVAGGLLDVAKAPFYVPTQVWRGHRLMGDFRRGVNDPILDILSEAGAWTGPRQDIYRMGSAPDMLQSIVRKELGSDFMLNLKRIIERDPNGDLSLLQIPGRTLGFAAHEYARLLTTTTAPLFDFLTPRLKLAANYEQMQTALRIAKEKGVPLSDEELFNTSRQIVKNTDDRLGEMNMNNTFWPKTVKQLAQVAMISPSWVYGYGRMSAAAVGFDLDRMRFEKNPVAGQAIIAFMMANALINTTYQYFMTGKLPYETDSPLHDIISPRSGGINIKTGAPERAQLPTQMKEALDYARVAMVTASNPAKFGEAVTHFIQNKFPSVNQIVKAFMTGEDPIGHHVTTSPGTFASYMLRASRPIWASTPEQRLQGSGIPEWQNWVFGIRPAMPHVADPSAFFAMQDRLNQRDIRDDYNRAVRENRFLETPQELPAAPAPVPGRGGGGGSSRATREPYGSDPYAQPSTRARRSAGSSDPYADWGNRQRESTASAGGGRQSTSSGGGAPRSRGASAPSIRSNRTPTRYRRSRQPRRRIM